MRCRLAEPATPRVRGFDDFAFRKGRADGAILVDLERSAEAVIPWLAQHPGITAIFERM